MSRRLQIVIGVGALVAGLLHPVGVGAAPADPGVAATSQGPSAALRAGYSVANKGGAKTCPPGSKIRVHAAFAQPLRKDSKVVVRIYSSPSRSTGKDRRRVFTGADYDDVWVVGGIRSGYWNVRSSPGKHVLSSTTYVRYAKNVPAGAPKARRPVGKLQCAKGRELRFYSNARGVVRHQWIAGPPHLGYRWKGGVVARSRALQDDQTYTNRRSVYGAKVTASGFKGAPGRIDAAYLTCRRR